MEAVSLLLPIAAMLLLLLAGMEIGFALGISGVVALFLWKPEWESLNIIGYIAWTNTASFTLSAVPLFMFTGVLIGQSGLAIDLYDGLRRWVARVPGSMLNISLIFCTWFAAVCGSSTASAAAVTRVSGPELKRLGYDKGLLAATLAAGGTLGPLIPPSIAMVIYGYMTEQSVGQLFMAGVVPGLMLATMFIGYVTIRAWLSPSLAPAASVETTWRERIAALKSLLPMTAIGVVITGGIYTGVMTPTEAAGVGAAATVLVLLALRKLSRRLLVESLKETAVLVGVINLVVVGSLVLSNGLTRLGMSDALLDVLGRAALPGIVVFALVVLLYTILGALMDPLSMMLMTLPLVYPIIQGLGYDLVWFGVIMVVLIELACITPPVGLNLFTVMHIMGKEFELWQMGRASVPFIVILLLLVVLLYIFPDLALWLPRHMLK